MTYPELKAKNAQLAAKTRKANTILRGRGARNNEKKRAVSKLIQMTIYQHTPG
jgi:hypothetical protein